MLDGFESRLADLFADLLLGATDLLAPARSRPSVLPGTGILPVVGVRSAMAMPVMGDDAPRLRRAPGTLGLRTEIALRGTVAIDLIPAATVARDQRLRAADAVLVALQDEAVRRGAAFDDDTDRGFRLHGFRFRRLGPADPDDELPRGTQRLLYEFEGSFWPVRPDATGPAIASIPTRIATLPVTVDAALVARAGGPDLVIPVTLDLRRLGATPGGVVARLRGAAPPGSLQGNAAGAPPGFTGFPVDATGVVRLVFRPAGAVAAAARADIQLALGGADVARTPLANITVQVLP